MLLLCAVGGSCIFHTIQMAVHMIYLFWRDHYNPFVLVSGKIKQCFVWLWPYYLLQYFLKYIMFHLLQPGEAMVYIPKSKSHTNISNVSDIYCGKWQNALKFIISIFDALTILHPLLCCSGVYSCHVCCNYPNPVFNHQ